MCKKKKEKNWRAGVVLLNGEVTSENCNDKEECELWILLQAEKGIKKSIIVNKKNIKERFIENWEGK